MVRGFSIDGLIGHLLDDATEEKSSVSLYWGTIAAFFDDSTRTWSRVSLSPHVVAYHYPSDERRRYFCNNIMKKKHWGEAQVAMCIISFSVV